MLYLQNSVTPASHFGLYNHALDCPGRGKGKGDFPAVSALNPTVTTPVFFEVSEDPG